VDLQTAIAAIPAGAWALGISGGADSVALADLARQRSELQVHLVHLDHELRGDESSGDAAFVQVLAQQWRLPLTLARRSELQADGLPGNPQAKYRALRLRLFAQVVTKHCLQGVLLAHHADDQAETVLLRLIRGAGIQGICGIPPENEVNGLRLVRPLLDVRGETLRAYLRGHGLRWREDSSNARDGYLRNRLRTAMRAEAQLGDALRELAHAAVEVRQWLAAQASPAKDELHVDALAAMPMILQRDLLRRWLIGHGVAGNETSVRLLQRIAEMASDAASPARANLPGGRHVLRRQGTLQIG
jgi:tRNA(Ile)-lysidine synthase